MEAGSPQTNPKLQPIADAIRTILDDRLKQVQGLGTGKLKAFIEDYFPHLWKTRRRRASAFAASVAKNPVEGAKGFLKQRTLPTLADGLAKGLEPVTENPVEAMMLRVREMDKYITAHQAFEEMKANGLVKKARARDTGKWGQKGYARINDNIATIYARPNRRGGLSIAGYYMAPDAVANVMNNYLSPGIRGNKYFGKAFRAYLGAGNLMNQVQLGLSFFHALNTSLDSATSAFSLGLKKIGAGDVKGGAKDIGKAAFTFVAPVVENWKQGSLLQQEWAQAGQHHPGSRGHRGRDEGGRRPGEDGRLLPHRLAGVPSKAWKGGNVVGAMFRLPMAAIETSAIPVMEKMVPRMKMGVFFNMAKFEMEQLGPGASRDRHPHGGRARRGTAWTTAWASWSTTTSFGTRRSRTWRWPAPARWAGTSARWRRSGRRPAGHRCRGQAARHRQAQARVTHRMAYAVAMPVMAGLLGGIIHTLLTGKHPEELKDWFFPKTGEKDKDGHDVRLSLPSYMKDVYAYGQNPGATLKNKVHPMLNSIMEMLANQDFYGTKIRNEDDSYVQQALDLAKHAGSAFTPFGVREVANLKAEGQGAKSLLPLVGIVQARRDITHSKAELLLSEIMADKMPKGSRTREEAERSQLVRDLSDKFNETGDTKDIEAAIREHRIPESAIEKIKERKRFNGFERGIRRLDAADAVKVWDVATPDERKQMVMSIVDKVHRDENLPSDQKAKLLARIAKDIADLKL
jgi:hypothetical protein